MMRIQWWWRRQKLKACSTRRRYFDWILCCRNPSSGNDSNLAENLHTNNDDVENTNKTSITERTPLLQIQNEVDESSQMEKSKTNNDDALIKVMGSTPRLDQLPIAVFREFLQVRDFVLLSMASKILQAWCEQALTQKRRLVDEPFEAHTLKNCPQIDTVQWSKKSSRFIDDAIVFNMLASCGKISSVIFSELDSVTDHAFEHLEKRELSRLELRNMRSISNRGLTWVAPTDL